MQTDTSIEIYVCSDARELAYGAVGYLRVNNEVEHQAMILTAKA